MPRKSLHSSINNLSYKSLLIILFFLLISIVVLWKFVLPNHKVEASWWNDGWNYRKAVSIGNSGTTTTNQYVKITLDTSSLITAGKMKNTCDDIRVTNINGKLLTHFVDGNASFACNTSTTSIYVLIDSIPSSGSTIYVYYGNPSAVNVEPILGTQQNPAISCKNILQHRSDNKGTQQYYIIPTGNMANSIQVTCDMTYSSGGWIQVWHGLPSEAFVNDATHESINLSNNIIFNEMRVEGTNLNFNVIDTVTQTAMLGSSIRTYFNQVHNAPDTPSPKVAFHNLSGTQSINLTNNYFMYGYGNVYRFFYTCIDVSGINDYYTGGGTPTCTPRSSFNPTSVGCASVNYCSNVRNTTPIDSGLHLSLYQYQESSVYVRENTITLNISQSMGTIAAEEVGGGPVAYWKFDEGFGTTAYDSTSNQNNGVISGATWSDESQCISGKCLNFKNASDVINAGNVTNSQNITASAWIYPTLNGNSSGGDIFMKLYSGSDPWVSFGTELYTNNKIRFAIDDNGYKSCLSTTQLELNKWYFITTRIDNSTMKGYINGKEECTYTRTTIMRFNTNPFRITGANFPDNFIGKIDDLKVYSYARTADQIKQDYNSRGSLSGSSVNMGSSNGGINLSDGLVGYWKMDEGVGTTTADYSGNSNTGTLSNVGWSSGKFGIGASFNGTTSYISTTKNFSSTTPYTIVLWAKPGTSLDTNRHNIIVGPGPVWNPGIWVANNKIRVHGATEYRDYTISWTDLSWHMLGQVFDGTTAYIIWDGQIVSGTRTVYSPSTPTQLFLGAENTTGNSYNWNGSMDEVRYYNRALSPAEVSQLYEYAPGPITYYDFNEASGTITYDKSGNNKNGTLQNSPSWTQGKYGGALDFKANNQRVLIGTTTPINGQATATLWYKRTNTASSTWRTILSDTTANIHQLSIHNTTRNLGLWDGSFRDFSYAPPDDNQFHHYAVVYDVGSSATLYVDGVYKSKIYTTLNLTTNPIGSIGNWSGGGYWSGSIDDVKIYNYARTQKQIIEDMNGGRPAASSKSPIGYWKFDEGYGTSVIDWGLGKNNGTFTGSTLPTWSNNGKFNKAVNFDNTTGSITMGDPTNEALDPGTNDFTISYWIKTNPSSTWILPIYKGGSSINTIGYDFELSSATHKLNFNLADSNSHYYTVTTSSSIDDNNWHHIVGVVDRSGALGTPQKSHLFVDGKEEGTPVNISLLESLSNSYPFDISKSGYTIKGLIDDVKIYKYALTAEDIKQDYNQNSALQMGQTSQTIGGTTTSLEYCIPGDTSYCAAPVGEWKMDEGSGTSAKDTSGNNLAGTITGATWAQGKIGKALNFSGSSQYVTITDNTLLKPTTAITAEAWFNTTDKTTTQAIISKTESSGYSAYIYGNDRIQFAVNVLGTYHTATYPISNINTNQWYHFTGIYDGSAVKIYLNGLNVGITNTTTGSITQGTPPLCIGSEPGSTCQDGGGQFFKGKIDGVKIYDYARTPAQIAYDYNKGGPVGWWKFDECQGNIAYDWSGIGNTGTIIIGASGTQNSLGTCSIGTSAAWTNGASGHTNGSLNFDGTDDYVSVNDNDILDPSQITISAWVKPSSLSNSGNFIGKGDNSGYRMRIYSTGSIGFLDRGSTNGLVTATGVCFVGNWYHIVGVGDNNGLKIYLNGKLLVQNSTAYGGPNTSSPLKIGLAMTSEYFQGQIDDVRIYNYALTPEQVKILYNNGAVNFN